jgi:hypothetical protein
MQELSKLDLEPNQIYNVSFNIKEGNKNIDTLRFFQTQVPKLFNIKTANFFTSSQIFETPGAVIKSDPIGGGSSGGGDKVLNVTQVKWTEVKTGDFSEGELTSEPTQVTYNFVISLNGYPKMMGYQLAGFTGFLSFLNFRNDYKPNGKTLTLSLTLSEIDPTAQREVSNASAVKTFKLTKAIAKGDTVIECEGLTGLVPLKTQLGGSESTRDQVAGTFVTPTYVASYTPGQNTFTITRGARIAQANGTNISVTNRQIVNGFTGTIYNGLKGGKTLTEENSSLVSGASFTYQTFPKYTAPSYKYTFKQNSSIRSSVTNPNIIEKLIWEDTVRDYIFFIITDGSELSDKIKIKKRYFFGTHGKITPATGKDMKNGTALTGTELFNSKNPPEAPEYLKKVESKSLIFSTDTIPFFSGKSLNQESEFSPTFKRVIEVRFAIARYIKDSRGNWNGYWLPGNSKNENDVLSSPEVLD